MMTSLIIILCLSFLSTVESNENMKKIESIIYREKQLTLNAIRNKISVYWITDYGVVEEDVTEKFQLFAKISASNIKFFMPLIIRYDHNSHNFRTKFLSNHFISNSAFIAYRYKNYKNNIYCKLFTNDEQHCKENQKSEIIKSSHFTIISNDFKSIFILKACHIFQQNGLDFEVQKELMIVRSIKTYKDDDILQMNVFNRNVLMYNLSFSTLNLHDFEICDHVKLFLLNYNEDKNPKAPSSIFLYLISTFLLFFIIFIGYELFKNFRKIKKITPHPNTSFLK